MCIRDSEDIVHSYEEEASKVNSQYDMGLLTDEERRQELINLWTCLLYTSRCV